MQYPIFIHKDLDSDYGVIIPDLPGCFSAGDTVEEAIQSSREAIACHLEGLLMDGDPIPFKRTIEHHLENPDFKDAILAFVEIDVSRIFNTSKSKGINVALPEKFLEQIDRYVKYYGGDRSALLVDATIHFITEHHFTEPLMAS